MADSSILIGCLKKLYDYAMQSGTVAAFYKIYSVISACFKGCFIWQACSKIGNTRLNKDKSVFYGLLDSVKKVVFKLFSTIYNAAKGGLFFKSASFLFCTSNIFKCENLFAIAIFAMFLCPHELWNNMYALAFALMLLFAYFIAVLRKRGFDSDVRALPLTVVLFIFSAAVSVLVSQTVSDSARVFMFFVTSLMFFVLTLDIANTKERFDKVSLAVYLAVFSTGIIAFYQRINGIAVDPSLTDTALNVNMPGRAFATLANPNNYAQFLIIFMPFCFSYALTRNKPLHKTVLLICLAVPVAALLLTYSRSGWLGFAAAALVFVVLYNKRFLPLLIIFIIAAIPFLPSSIMHRITTIGDMKDTSNYYRICIWTGALAMMKHYWFTGTGLGPAAFRRLYIAYSSEYAKPAPHTHMLFMEVAAEMGALGFIIFLCLIVSLLYLSLQSVSKYDRKETSRLYIIAAASSVAGILVIGVAEYVWFYPRVMFAFFIALGLAAAANKLRDQRI